MERLRLREVARILGYKDLRSAKRWCENNCVMVLSDIGTKGKYVILKEFEAARLRSFTKYLRLKHGKENWLAVFVRYTQQSPFQLISEEVKGVNTSSKGTERNKKGEAQGENEKRFLDDLRELLSTA